MRSTARNWATSVKNCQGPSTPSAHSPANGRTRVLSSRPIPCLSRRYGISSACTLNPPDHALVLCVDEKSQIQALNRTQPVLPIGLGYVEGITHDYVRHGTTTLFAALDIATGTVFTACKPRHRAQEFLSFLRHLDDVSACRNSTLHLIVDNYATHKHPKVRTLVARSGPAITLHYTPTYSSWLNQVERWFGLITQRAIRRGSFTQCQGSGARKSMHFVQHYNRSESAFPGCHDRTSDHPPVPPSSKNRNCRRDSTSGFARGLNG